jgi:hypothetical protein
MQSQAVNSSQTVSLLRKMEKKSFCDLSDMTYAIYGNKTTPRQVPTAPDYADIIGFHINPCAHTGY